MDLVELKQTLEAHTPSVVEVFRQAVPEAGLRKLDQCVLEYLLRMLEGQCQEESYLPDEIIIETLSIYFLDFEVCATEELSNKMSSAIIKAMEEKKLTRKPQRETTRLASAVNIGRQYEDNLKKASMMGIAKVTVNTNEDWTWDTKRSGEKDNRRRKKEEEKKAMLREEYEEFLRKRGVTSAQQVIKLHQKCEGAVYSTDIKCEDIHIHMGKQVLLDHADLILFTGHKYGLVGRNGTGKTTLLRALSEKELEGVSPFVQILHVEQEIVAGTETPLQVILSADVERDALMKEEQELLKRNDDESNARLAEVYERLEAIDAHSAESRAAAILHGLSFTQEMMTGPTKSLSGGWRMRVALARALFVEPEVLLLDEPTNHLDLHAVLWLENFLQEWKNTLIVVSHSRSFLNSVCEEIIHLNDHKLEYYTGNYDQFEITRAEQLRQQQKQFDANEKHRAHLQTFIDRFRCSAARAKMAQSRIKALERMEKIGPVVVDAAMQFRFPDPESASGPFMQIIDCEFGYKVGTSLFKEVNFGLEETSRVALVGANGAGKSTFLNVCLGKLEPRMGTVIRNQKIRIGHFAQHHLEHLTLQHSPLEFLRSKFPHVDEQQMRAHLGSFGLGGDKALQPIYTLSGGQKSRVALAWITFNKPHLLLLDEPTNHLDIDTVNALIESLMDYKGGLMVVSHDEHFITSLCDEIFVCADEKLVKFEGDFEAYKATIVAKMR